MKCFGDKTKTFHTKVVLLDEQELIQEVQETTTGQELLEVVFQHLNLLETSYFGLRYIDPSHQTHWLDPNKRLAKQLKGTNPFTLYFSVKFYAADPTKLIEEITRYQFFLQVKQDILQGRLPISQELTAELGALAVQSELGDYDPRRHSPGYVSEFRFSTSQSVVLESKIADHHKKLVGQVPSKAELAYLEKVKWLDMYGVDLHPVLGEDSTEYFLGLTPSGIIVLRNKAKVGNYFWPRITKVFFRGKFFMLRVKDKNNGENTYGFETPSKSACKHLWQCCVEHHAFFRLTQAAGNSPQAIFSLGSKFRYSGRTEKEAVMEAKINARPQIEFARTPSRRYQRRIVEGAQDTPRVEDVEPKPSETRTVVSLPTSVMPASHVYRSTSMTLSPRSDSPRSTRSAPYPASATNGHISSQADRGNATMGREGRPPARTESPRSVKSGLEGRERNTRRTSSLESHSSADSRSCSRSCSRHRKGRCRSSDGESEASSKCSSSKGHRRHRHRHHHHHRHRHHSDDSSDHHKHRHRRHRRRSSEREPPQMVESSVQWANVQAGQTPPKGHTVATVRDLTSGYSASAYDDTEPDSQAQLHSARRKHRKHKSPSENKHKPIPEEIRRHIDFNLKTPDGMTENQLREIPYTRIEAPKNSKARFGSPKGKRHKSPKRSRSNNSDRKENGLKNEMPDTTYDEKNISNGMSPNLHNGDMGGIGGEKSTAGHSTQEIHRGFPDQMKTPSLKMDGASLANGGLRPFPRSNQDSAMIATTTNSNHQEEAVVSQPSSPLRGFTPLNECQEDGTPQRVQKEKFQNSSPHNYERKETPMSEPSKTLMGERGIHTSYHPTPTMFSRDQVNGNHNIATTYSNTSENGRSPYLPPNHPPSEGVFLPLHPDSHLSSEHMLQMQRDQIEEEEEELSSGFMDSSSGGFMGHPPFLKAAVDRGPHMPSVLKPQPSPQSSVTSGISVGSSSASATIADFVEGEMTNGHYCFEGNSTSPLSKIFPKNSASRKAAPQPSIPPKMFHRRELNNNLFNGEPHGKSALPNDLFPIQNNLKGSYTNRLEGTFNEKFQKNSILNAQKDNSHLKINVTHIVNSYNKPLNNINQSKPILKSFASDDNLLKKANINSRSFSIDKLHLYGHSNSDRVDSLNNNNKHKNKEVRWNIQEKTNNYINTKGERRLKNSIMNQETFDGCSQGKSKLKILQDNIVSSATKHKNTITHIHNSHNAKKLAPNDEVCTEL